MAETCRIFEVDGEPVRVHGGEAMTPEGVAMFADVVRAAKRKAAAEKYRASEGGES